MLRPDEWVALIGAIATLIGAAAAALVSMVRANAESAKTRAEIEAMHAGIAETASMVRETHHQVTPNNGGSLMDSSTRNEEALAVVLSRLDHLDTAARDTAADVRGLRRDVGRLADADAHLIARKEQEHDAIHARLDALDQKLGQHAS